ncbi:hypothetical protein APUTEX25_005683, partial [Auxenochlorella protothecoides]
DPKTVLKALQSRKEELEAEIATCSYRLQNSGVGLHAPLVDAEGFPRADLDIPSIRAGRQKVRVLSHDLEELTREMEIQLHALHAAARQQPDAGTQPSSDGAPPPPAVPAAAEATPFAEVTAVAPGSPAAGSGMQPGDRLVAFGDVSSQTPRPVEGMAQVLPSLAGRAVRCEVLRAGRPVTLAITPGPWAGKGLLGATLILLS